jgi:hypothetical protein
MIPWKSEHTDVSSRRNIYYHWISNCWRRQTLQPSTIQEVAFYVAGTLLKILKDSKDQYPFSFMILSARARL